MNFFLPQLTGVSGNEKWKRKKANDEIKQHVYVRTYWIFHRTHRCDGNGFTFQWSDDRGKEFQRIEKRIDNHIDL